MCSNSRQVLADAVFCHQLGDDHGDRSQLERVIEGWVCLVVQGVWRHWGRRCLETGRNMPGKWFLSLQCSWHVPTCFQAPSPPVRAMRAMRLKVGWRWGHQGNNRDTRERIGTLEEGLGHEGEVRGEVKEGRTLLLISVDLANHLYKLSKAKRKEGQEAKECEGRPRKAKECEGMWQKVKEWRSEGRKVNEVCVKILLRCTKIEG